METSGFDRLLSLQVHLVTEEESVCPLKKTAVFSSSGLTNIFLVQYLSRSSGSVSAGCLEGVLILPVFEGTNDPSTSPRLTHKEGSWYQEPPPSGSKMLLHTSMEQEVETENMGISVGNYCGMEEE